MFPFTAKLVVTMALTEVIGITVFKTIRIPLSRKLFSVKETNMFFPLHLGTFDLSHQAVVDWMESDKYKNVDNNNAFQSKAYHLHNT